MKPLAAALTLLLAACAATPTRHYYTLVPRTPATRFSEPYPVKLRVRDLEMRRSYRRDELVFRSDVSELTFSRSRRWSEPPQRMVSALVREQVRASNLAGEVQDDSATVEPDYVLGGEIEAIEELDVVNAKVAHLVIALRLQRFKDDSTVWTYRIDARRPVSGTSVRSTVRVLSDLLAQETDRAIADLGRYLADPSGFKPAEAQAPAPPPPATVGGAAAAAAQGAAGPGGQTDLGVVVPDDASPLVDLPQLQRDDTALPVGMGAVFVPSLSDGDREPRVGVYRGGATASGGKLGERIVLAPGDYEVRVGSGAISQQREIKVRVVEGKTTVVPPSWASLDIMVVDESFVPYRGTYELIRMATREDYGLGFGADEQLGEVTRVWVLPPGLYKIIRSGGTYRDRTDFATVRLEAGKLTRFTLVIDPTSGAFRGAGENDPDLADLTSSDEAAAELWQLRAVVGGDLNFNRTSEVGTQPGWKLSFHVFFDGSARFALGPHVWYSRLEIEEGQTRLLAKETFQNDTDRLYLNTIYTYQLLRWFGPYVRFGLESKLLPRHEDFDQPQDVAVLDASGAVDHVLTGVSRVELGSTFAPLQLKEGTGGNFRVLRTNAVELDLRLGFGARQTLANGLYIFENDPVRGPILVPVEDSSLLGFEGTVVGIGRLTRFITLTTELDGLVPVTDDAVVYTWRNQVNLRLVSFISLNYRFNVTRDPNLGIGDQPRTEHDVQLRFSYVIF